MSITPTTTSTPIGTTTDTFTYHKTCKGCGNEFDTPNFRQLKCKPNCGRDQNKARAARALAHILDFAGVDGEGVDRPNGNHDYVMLSIGDQTLTNPDGSELTFRQIADFLWQQYLERPNAVFIGFYLGYDFTQWTKGLTEDQAFMLWTNTGAAMRKPKNKHNPTPFPVHVEGYEIDILAGRRWRMRKHVCMPMKLQRDVCRCGATLDWTVDDIADLDTDFVVPATGYGDDDYDWLDAIPTPQPVERERWMYVSDTGGFWQCSLMSALNPKDWPTPVVSDEEYATLQRGKDTRAKVVPYGDTTVFAEMMAYNILENDVLARMTTVLNDGFMGMDTPLKLGARDWYGPGRAAQEWLNIVSKSASSPITNRELSEIVPRFAFAAGRNAYYGGWFEQFIHGHIPGSTYEYDINSAYPAVIATLPCLAHGDWTEGDGAPNDLSRGYTLVQVTVRGTNTVMGPVPHRSPQGRISRPLVSKGWHWWHEIEASIAAGLVESLEIHAHVQYTPCGCPPPLAGIKSMYEQRLRIGKKTPQGRAYKLVYNSSYGKFAQSIGMPKFSNPIYASLITAGCRVSILRAISTHPMGYRAVTMVATDGVYFRTPHPTLVEAIPDDATPEAATLIRDKLGGWSMEVKENMTQLMPGVYWDDKTRELVRDGGAPQLKSRGISAKDLAAKISDLDDSFTTLSHRVENSLSWEWPVLNLSVSFAIVSAKSAIHRRRWGIAGAVTHDANRIVNADPGTKRKSDSLHIVGDVLRTNVHNYRPELIETTYYRKQFGMELEETAAEYDYVNQDGRTDALIARAMMERD